jgi:hypothetical protein
MGDDLPAWSRAVWELLQTPRDLRVPRERRLTPRARSRLERLIVDDKWPIARAVGRFEVAWPTVCSWAIRLAYLPCTAYCSVVGCAACPTSTATPGEPVHRYEHAGPDAMLDVDVKNLGNIPDGDGWRFVGRRQAKGTGLPLQTNAAAPQPQARHHRRAHRNRRLLGSPTPNPRRQIRCYRERRTPPRCRLVRRPRHHHRKCPIDNGSSTAPTP